LADFSGPKGIGKRTRALRSVKWKVKKKVLKKGEPRAVTEVTKGGPLKDKEKLEVLKEEKAQGRTTKSQRGWRGKE